MPVLQPVDEDEEEQKEGRVVIKSRLKRIAEPDRTDHLCSPVEYFFIENDLMYQKVFHEKITSDPEGWMPISAILRCTYLDKETSATQQLVRKALKDHTSSPSEVRWIMKEEGLIVSVRRKGKTPLPKLQANMSSVVSRKKSAENAKRSPVSLTFANINNVQSQIKHIIKSHKDGEMLKEGSLVYDFVHAVLMFHPNADEKFEDMVGIKIDQYIANKESRGGMGSRCFWIVKDNQTAVDMSYTKCIKALQVSPLHVKASPKHKEFAPDIEAAEVATKRKKRGKLRAKKKEKRASADPQTAARASVDELSSATLALSEAVTATYGAWSTGPALELRSNHFEYIIPGLFALASFILAFVGVKKLHSSEKVAQTLPSSLIHM